MEEQIVQINYEEPSVNFKEDGGEQGVEPARAREIKSRPAKAWFKSEKRNVQKNALKAMERRRWT